ncbi:hypothetical protein [Methanoregula sp.]|uniref:outer membrane lipoprotein-sorting protein n=1 Tax=Methanoregula sp. TaxID=2052170 RepID=UPI00356900DF
MNKLLWLIAAALAVLIIIGCVLSVPQHVPPGHNNSGPVFSGNNTVQKSLHEMSAEEIAAEFVRHNNNISGYSADVHSVGENGYDDDEYRFYVTRPDKFRAEYSRSEIHGNDTIVVANGSFVWQYYPDTKKARPDLIEDPKNTFFAWKDYPAIAARILERFPAVLNGTEHLNGSDAVIIETAVDDVPTQYYPTIFRRARIWIDEDTLMLTRMVLIGDYNETALAVDLRNISINPPLSGEMFDFTPPPGTEISPTITELVAPLNMSSMYQAKVRFGPDFRLPSTVPAGYTFRYCFHYRDQDGRDSIVYSNDTDDLVFTQAFVKTGVSRESVTEQDMPVFFGNLTGRFRTVAGRNEIDWQDKNRSYVLIGTLPQEELVRIARSVTTPALLNFAPEEIKNPETIAEIALRDTSARRMVDAGGEILGVGMSLQRGTKNSPGGFFPALSVRYNQIVAEYMVDPVSLTVVKRSIQVPNGAMVREKGNRTLVEFNGEILFAFDPMEATP